LAAIPRDATSCLEIGFLDLRLTRKLSDRLDVVSIDLPRPVWEQGRHKLVFADVRGLPFKDRAFDLVCCTEVLEHLPAPVLARGVQELQRVSSKYILVTVPFRQRVWNQLFKCRYCGYLGNTMGHLHYFDELRLGSLFPDMLKVREETIGEVSGDAPDWLYTVARVVGQVSHRNHSILDVPRDTCPHCLRPDAATPPNSAGWVIQRIVWRIERAMPTCPAWLLALFSRAPGQ
jgi:hypothetical protein